jgi:hypothetical protein
LTSGQDEARGSAPRRSASPGCPGSAFVMLSADGESGHSMRGEAV